MATKLLPPTVAITKEAKHQLDQFARATGRTRVHIVADAVTEYINRKQEARKS